MDSIAPDVVGEIVYHLADGLFAIQGHAPLNEELHRPNFMLHQRRLISLHEAHELQRFAYNRCSDRLKDGVRQWNWASASDEVDGDRARELLNVCRRAVRSMMALASTSKSMARTMRQHWRPVYDLLAYLAFFLREVRSFVVPKYLPERARVPAADITSVFAALEARHLPGTWYRMAVCRIFAGKFKNYFERTLRRKLYKEAPAALAHGNPRLTLDHMRDRGLIHARGPDEPRKWEWITRPICSALWLKQRYEQRQLYEKHVKVRTSECFTD